MIIVVIQAIALIVQCITAVLAVRLIRVTGRYAAWLLIALSIVLIVARRTIAFGRLFLGDLDQTPSTAVYTESIILLIISIIQAGGILLIAPLFQAMRNKEEELLLTNVEIERQVKERTQQLVEQNMRLEDAYAKLRELESSRDGLTHMIVHDLRTPLTSVYGFLTTLEREESKALSESGQEFLRIAIESTRSLSDQVSSLLDVNKMEAGRMELKYSTWNPVVELKEILDKLTPLQGQRQVVVSASESPIYVSADINLIARVVQNILGNAFRFTQDDAQIVINVAQRDDWIRIAVTDNGPGIPSEYHAAIFEKFKQMDPQKTQTSTGLGLTFCKLAVEAHGGRIGVESEVGKGSTFWFEIPVHANQVSGDN